MNTVVQNLPAQNNVTRLMFPPALSIVDRPQLRFENDVHPVDAANEAWAKRKQVDALRSVDEINTMVRYFLDKDMVRDAVIFIVGCNTGLRISDILMLRWKDALQEINRIKMQKTQRYVTFYPNEAVTAGVMLYREIAQQSRRCDDDDYMFVSESGHQGYVPCKYRGQEYKTCRPYATVVQPLRKETVCRTMTKAGKASGLAAGERRVSTHTCRKTHAEALDGYVEGFDIGQDMKERVERVAGVMLAQTALGHARPETTRSYYLMKDRELHQECCRRMNFGLEEILNYKNRKGS